MIVNYAHFALEHMWKEGKRPNYNVIPDHHEISDCVVSVKQTNQK